MTLTGTRLAAIAGAACVAAAILLLWPREKDDPEEKIRRKVVQMARAAEQKDVAFVMEQVSETFRGGDGFTKQELKGFLLGQILRGNWVRVFVADMKVTVNGGSADFQGKFVFGRSEAARLEELAKESVMGSYRVDAKLALESGEWRFVSATWTQDSLL